MGGRASATEAIVALGMMLSGSILVAAWMISAIPNRDAPAIIGFALIGLGLLIGLVAAQQAGKDRRRATSGNDR